MPKYTADDITVLSEIEHIRTRPEMYIGQTENPTHLVYEIVDNALDESMDGYADIIGIDIDDSKHEITIADNGRGIPINNDVAITIATKLFSGGKFKKGKDKAYKTSSGLHGIGIVAVTALSDYMTIEIYRDNKYAKYYFEDGQFKNKVIKSFTGKKPFSTQICFKPSKKYFDSLNINLDDIKNRMKLASVNLNHLRLLLCHNGKNEIIDYNINDYLIEILFDGKKDKNVTDFIHLQQQKDDEKVDIRFCFSLGGKITPVNRGCVNLLSVDQGTHINMSNELIREIIYKFAQKRKSKLQKQDCIIGLRCYTSIFLYDPKYSSQTKERLTVKKDNVKHLYDPLYKKLEQFFNDNIEYVNNYINYVESYKRKIDASSVINQSNTNIKTRTSITINGNLRNCSSSDTKNTELFIVEGSSAAGSLIQCRDPKVHAIMPLKGKIMNIISSSKEYYKNKELVELINAIGTGVEKDCNIKDIAYGKIIIATDADSDGFHIASLLLTFFLKIMPDIIKYKKLYLAQIPLYGAKLKNKFIPLFTEEELEQFKMQNPKIQIHRYKGLGEMNPEELKVCLLDKNKRRLILIEEPNSEKDKEYIFNLMIDPELKRQIV